MPPVGVTVAVPSHTPLQLIFVLSVMDEVNIKGSERVTRVVSAHPFASVTITVSVVPAHKPVAVESVCPLFHR